MTEVACQCCDCIERCPSISLQEWFEIMCVIPYFGFQLADLPKANIQPVLNLSLTPCESLIFEDPSQGGQIAGRRWIWNALLTADEKFHNYAGYWPAPTQCCDEMHFQKPYHSGTLRLKDAKLVALGEITHTEIETVAIPDAAFLDLNGDTIIDTVRITVAKPADITSLEEVTLFLAPDDRYYVDSFCRAQVRPIKVTERVAGTLEIDIPVWNLVRPVLYRGYSSEALDVNTLDNYVDQVVLYRTWIDASKAITIMRRTDVSCGCNNDSEECYACESVDACIVNAKDGLIRLDMRQTDKDSCYCSKCAHRVCIKYVAGDCGYPELIARLAAAELRGDICCGTSPEVRYWQQDYVGVDSRGRIQTSLLESEQGNAFGTKRGQVEAYRFLRTRRVFKAIRI